MKRIVEMTEKRWELENKESNKKAGRIRATLLKKRRAERNNILDKYISHPCALFYI